MKSLHRKGPLLHLARSQTKAAEPYIHAGGRHLTHRLGYRVVEEGVEVFVVVSEAATRNEQLLPLLLHLRVVSRFHFHALALRRPIVTMFIVHKFMVDEAAGLKLAVKKGYPVVVVVVVVGSPF